MNTTDHIVRALFVVDGVEPAPDSVATADAIFASGIDWTILAAVPQHPQYTSGATGFAGPVLTLEQADELAMADLIAGDAATAGTARGFDGRPVKQEVVRGTPGEAVARYIAEHPTDLVVVDSPDLAHTLIGDGTIPVLVTPRTPIGSPGGPVLFAVDDSPLDDTLLSTAARLLHPLTTDSVVVHVGEARSAAQAVPITSIAPGSLGAEMASMIVDDLGAASAEAERLARTSVVGSELDNVTAVGEAGDPASGILLAAEEHDASMIVVGSHDRGFLSRLLRPSVSDAVLRRSHRPVLVIVPTGDSAPLDPGTDDGPAT